MKLSELKELGSRKGLVIETDSNYDFIIHFGDVNKLFIPPDYSTKLTLKEWEEIINRVKLVIDVKNEARNTGNSYRSIFFDCLMVLTLTIAGTAQGLSIMEVLIINTLINRIRVPVARRYHTLKENFLLKELESSDPIVKLREIRLSEITHKNIP